MSGLRRTGYRLLGARFDYLLHTRPAEWPIMAGHTLVGYLLAVGLDGVIRGEYAVRALFGLLAWVVCLNGGTLALNSAYDRDEGDVGYLRQPPPPPRYLAEFSFGLMVLGLAIATRLPRPYLAAYALCCVLSVLYSVPPFRLKAVAGADWLLNMVGFGVITPFAMWTITEQPVDLARGLALLAFCPLFAALYPLTQLYQIEEDTRRGDQTFARRLGVRRSLVTAAGATALAFALFAAGAVRAGWHFDGDGRSRWLALAVAAAVWMAALGPWVARADRLSAGEHQRRMYLALAAWAVTDVVVVVAWGT